MACFNIGGFAYSKTAFREFLKKHLLFMTKNTKIGYFAYLKIRHMTLFCFLELPYTWRMSQNIPILCDCEVVCTYLTSNLEEAGYQIIRSFDLQRARSMHTVFACPHHGTTECNCQMIVLLIYLLSGEPRSLIAHGRDGVTYLAWDEELPTDEELALFTIINNTFTQAKSIGKNEVPASIK